MRKNLKFLIIGCGKIAKIHARIINEQFNNIEIFCLDKSNKIMEEFIKEFNAKSFDKKLHYDALLICTPTDKHLEVLKKYKNYASYYFIEKPLVNSKSDFDEILKIVDTKTVYCGLIELHNDIFLELKKMLKNEKVISFQITRHSPELISDRISSDVHLDLAIHDLSVLFKYFIEFSNLEKFEIIKNFKNKNFYETAEIILKDKKVNASISVSRKTNKKIRHWRIITDSKTYEVDLISKTITVYELKDIQIDSKNFTQKIIEFQNSFTLNEPAINQMNYFVSHINKSGFQSSDVEIIHNSHMYLLDV